MAQRLSDFEYNRSKLVHWVDIDVYWKSTKSIDMCNFILVASPVKDQSCPTLMLRHHQVADFSTSARSVMESELAVYQQCTSLRATSVACYTAGTLLVLMCIIQGN